MSHKTLLLLTVDTEASLAGLRPLPAEPMVWGRVGGGTWGIERIMDCCEARGMRATFFVSTLEALHHGDDHVRRMCGAALGRGHDAQLHVHPIWLDDANARKAITELGPDDQRRAVELGADVFRRTCDGELVAHRAGGLWLDAGTLRAVEAAGIPSCARSRPPASPSTPRSPWAITTTTWASRRPTCPAAWAASSRCP